MTRAQGDYHVGLNYPRKMMVVFLRLDGRRMRKKHSQVFKSFIIRVESRQVWRALESTTLQGPSRGRMKSHYQ